MPRGPRARRPSVAPRRVRRDVVPRSRARVVIWLLARDVRRRRAVVVARATRGRGRDGWRLGDRATDAFSDRRRRRRAQRGDGDARRAAEDRELEGFLQSDRAAGRDAMRGGVGRVRGRRRDGGGGDRSNAADEERELWSTALKFNQFKTAACVALYIRFLANDR